MRTAWLAVLVVACGPSSPPPTTPAPIPVAPGSAAAPIDPATPAPPQDQVRLASGLTVVRYTPRLTIDPDQPTFTGEVNIEARLPAPRREIMLHADRLVIATATATAAGKDAVPLTVRAAGPGRIAVTAAADLPAGDVAFHLAYSGAIDDTDTMGVFRQQTGNRWYAFTQFESIGARRAFPCIDEPGVKVPWRLILDIPVGTSAVSNTPVASDFELSPAIVSAVPMHRVIFEPTPPLPSYLVAFGVGPFEFVDAGKAPGGAPIRIVVPAGRSADAAVAAELTPKVVAWLEDWFGMPFPYAKIDALAIPITVSFGAMENAGLITYRADILLMPADAPEAFRRRYARYAAHELAHQWFGDFVTPAWWDDIWLNESFATWLPYKLTRDVFPAWTNPAALADGRGDALGADSLGTARRIRQPIATEDDIVSAFDGITYGKGAAVLHMFELWAGEEQFQRGVRDYLTAHAHGNATAADFLAAVSAATGADITGTMSTFLDQAGAPRLDARLTCDGDRARIEVAQARYLPMGAAPAATSPVWKLPVCVVYGAPGIKAGTAGARHEVCALVTTPTATLTGDGCVAGAWMYANAGARGYHRTAIVDGLAAILTDGWRHLDAGERLAVAQDVFAAVAAGETGIATALDLVPRLMQETTPPAIQLATGVIEGARRFLPAKDPAIARWVRAQYGPAAKKLGWKPKPGEPVDATELRELIVPLVAELGRDPTLIKQAVALARSWRTLPPGGSRGDLLRVAVRAKPALADRLRADFVAETDRITHTDLAVALGRVDDRTELEASLALLFDAKVDVREANLILREANSDPVTQAWAQAWVVAHLDELIARFPGEGAARLVNSLSQSCDPDQVAPMRAIADAKIKPLSGGPRAIDQAFEGLAQCIAQRHAVEPALAAWRKTLK